MHEHLSRPYLRLSDEAQLTLVDGARDASPVRGLTHCFYKYPARFSPRFARAAIDVFTCPGDLVLDPHVGGGTTLVEAISTGREAVGVDISTLAKFVSSVKLIVFSDAELAVLERWAKRIDGSVDMHRPSHVIADYEEMGYYKHLNHPSRWRLRKAIEQSLSSATRLRSPRLRSFGRCVVLRTAQWALDGRSKKTSVENFRRALRETALEMVVGAKELRSSVKSHGKRMHATILRRSAAGIEEDQNIRHLKCPKLVVTSPPYPGIHILYHRWQVDGRKEAPLPFMIANCLDGSGGSYYTMGDRHNHGLSTYFANITATMSSVAALADRDTTVVQMLAFSDLAWQLPQYLECMAAAGLEEVFLPILAGQGDGRLWRKVPGRRWYNSEKTKSPGAQEVVLFHRKTPHPPITMPDRSATFALA